MPQKKKKYNARFPPGRIKKIMQTDEEVGKVAAAVPIMISRTLELFVESLLVKTMSITNARQARTLSPSHMRQCIMSESRFDFLRELVKDIPTISWNDEFAPDAGDSTASSAAPAAIMPAHSSSNGHHPHQQQMMMHFNDPRAEIDRPRRSNYKRPMSYDADSHSSSHNYSMAQMSPSSSSCGLDLSYHDSPSVILKRKLLDPSRKSASTEVPPRTTRNNLAKLARLDSSPAAFSEQRKPLALTTRRRRSNDVQQEPVLLPPSMSFNTESMSTPIIKIDYNQPNFASVHVPGSQPEITPVINIDFSNLITSTAPIRGDLAAAGLNGSQGRDRLLLSTAAVEAKAAALATPNLTTPTRLNLAPSFPGVASSTATAFPPPTVASTLEMDEDYDDL